MNADNPRTYRPPGAAAAPRGDRRSHAHARQRARGFRALLGRWRPSTGQRDWSVQAGVSVVGGLLLPKSGTQKPRNCKFTSYLFDVGLFQCPEEQGKRSNEKLPIFDLRIIKANTLLVQCNIIKLK